MKLLAWLQLATLALASPVDFVLPRQVASTDADAASADAAAESDVDSSAAAYGGSTCSKYPDNPKACWRNGYDIDTDTTVNAPDTGVVREYFFDVRNITLSPDGRPREVMAINGQIPGPTIVGNWGDTFKITVRNSLQNNGSSIHWHGIRQVRTNQNDGVPSLTQCPIAPGSTYTYTWRATEYGSGWYHSHFSLQAWDGVFGGVTINGPASANYDVDLGHMFLNDWSHLTADQMYLTNIRDPTSQRFESGLLNGTNTYTYPNGTVVGKRLSKTVVPGKRYRLRLVNSALHTQWKFSIDSHIMKVIAMDYIPIRPFDSNYVTIDMGQRYDIIFTANQAKGSYWFRSVPQTFCSIPNDQQNDIKGIIRYEGTPVVTPTSTKQNYGDDFQCDSMPYDKLVPWVPKNAALGPNYNITASNGPKGSVFLWQMGKAVFSTRWDDPTLRQTQQDPNKVWTDGQNVIQTNKKDEWTVFVIQTYFALSHPIHLHGHDFWILASGLGTFNSAVKLNLTNPARRDTVTLRSQPPPPGQLPNQSAGGYVVIAWPADNPGIWLMHCHVGFHAEAGFALQVLERKTEIPALVNNQQLNQSCSQWNNYKQISPYGTQYTGYDGPYKSGI